MWLFYASILLVILSNVFYQYIQKMTPNNVNPALALTVTYLTAAAACILLYPFFQRGESLLSSIKRLNWTSYALGFAIIGLEIGFLLAYRAGWNISTAGVFANVAVALLLVPIGIIVFKESLNTINVAGIALCVLGLFLMTRR